MSANGLVAGSAIDGLHNLNTAASHAQVSRRATHGSVEPGYTGFQNAGMDAGILPDNELCKIRRKYFDEG
jgi:hypothetical protein